MKKRYSSKSAWMGVALCTFLLVACGLKVTKVTLSANEIVQGGEVTVATQFERADNDLNNNENIYLLYALRVPSDWSATTALDVVSKYQGETTTMEFKNCEAYAKLAEFSFPKEGYKWLGFQTKDRVTLNCDNNGEDNLVATLTLKSGDATGDFKLDVISGSFPQDPSYLLNADGTVNVNVAFGCNINFEPEEPYTLDDGTKVFSFSEYLVNASTISPAERKDVEKSLLSYTSTVMNTTYPISAGIDVGNALTDEEIAQLQLNVKVIQDPSAVNEIEIAAEENSPVYNLQGVEVAEPTAPGIYIKNGKKFVVK